MHEAPLPAGRSRRPACRRTPLAAAALVLLPTLGAAQAPPAAPVAGVAGAASLAASVHRDSLDNGLQILVVESRTVPMATLNLVVRNGAYTQNDGEAGVAHLFEHMLFEAYRGPRGQPFGYEAGSLQAGYNGTTSFETVTYYLTLPARNVAGGLRVLGRLMRPNGFEQKTLHRERMVVMDEFNRRVSEPEFLLAHEVDAALWGSGFTRRNTIGSRVDLLAATPERLDSLFRRYYVPNNAALVVTGDVQHADVVRFAREHFGGWRRGGNPFADPIPPMPLLEQNQGTIIEHADAQSVTLLVAFQGPSVRDAEMADAALLFSEIVNERGSAMQRRLVDSGLFESLELDYDPLVHSGSLQLRGRTSPEKLGPALVELKAELGRFGRDGYVEADELAWARARARVGQAFMRERPNALAHTLGTWWSLGALDRYLALSDHVELRSPEELQRFAWRYLTIQARVAGLLVPEGRGQALAPLLETFVTAQDDVTGGQR